MEGEKRDEAPDEPAGLRSRCRPVNHRAKAEHGEDATETIQGLLPWSEVDGWNPCISRSLKEPYPMSPSDMCDGARAKIDDKQGSRMLRSICGKEREEPLRRRAQGLRSLSLALRRCLSVSEAGKPVNWFCLLTLKADLGSNIT